VENYEYELPSDFEDEEIDEDMAFTAEDKKLYAGWFGEEEEEEQEAGSDGDAGGQQQRRSKRSKLGEFADLESSSDEEQDGDEVGVCWQTQRCSWAAAHAPQWSKHAAFGGLYTACA
jgi:U3 small nucleolar RNA-associated protein 14